jgi:hypothetical protein
MAISEEERRHELYRSLEQVHGRAVATTLMEHLPPVGWSDVARQSDVAALATELRSEMHTGFTRLSARMDRLEARFEARFEQVDARFDGMDARFETRFEGIEARFEGINHQFEALEARMSSKVDQLRAEMHEGFGAVRTDFAAIIAAQTRAMMLLVLGSVLTVAALAFAVTRFP